MILVGFGISFFGIEVEGRYSSTLGSVMILIGVIIIVFGVFRAKRE
jgi:hypothetical protein